MSPLASVVIPAHDEAGTIETHLRALLDGTPDLDVVVVCNGCTDATAELARRAAPSARVIEIPQASKTDAVAVGNAVTSIFPRVHLDADVQLSGASLVELVRPLADGSALATAPLRILPMAGCSLPVRAYYEVWERLPQVREGLFGRGAIALSEEGQRRVSRLPRVLSDDLVASDAFAPGERRIVPTAAVVVRPPRRLADLVRRRIRVVTGNAQADELALRRGDSITTLSDLAGLALREPRLVPRVPVFLAVTAVARLLSRRAVRSHDYTTWHRDESSRRPPRPAAQVPLEGGASR